MITCSIIIKVLIIVLAYNILVIKGDCAARDTELTAVTGQINYLTSPNYPDEYPPSTDCGWKISAPSVDHRVELVVLDFEVEGDCVYDSVTVYDGDSAYANVIIQLCDSGHPVSSNFVSTGQFLYVAMHTDDSVQEKGFQFSYTSFALHESCPPNWERYGKDCYKLLPSTSGDWHASQESCGYSASNLASIHTEQEETFLVNTYMVSSTPVWVWIGAMYTDDWSNFTWIDRSSYNYTNWKISEPQLSNGKCCALDSRLGEWSMQPCGTSYAALCKKDIVGTTIVYHSVGKDGGTGFEFWEIPGIIIAVIVIGTIAYTMLRHFCKCLAETCESVCDCCGNMFSSCKRRIDRCYDGGCECSRCERFDCIRSHRHTCYALVTCRACRVYCSNLRRREPETDPPQTQQSDDNQQDFVDGSVELSIHVSESESGSSSISSSHSSIIIRQPSSVHLRPTAPVYDAQGPPPSYEDLNFGDETGGAPLSSDVVPTPPPDYPPPSYELVETRRQSVE